MDKERIVELRKQGKGYKAIANELGLSRDAVRSVCIKNGLNGYFGNKDLFKADYGTGVCVSCGEIFEKKSANHTWCGQCERPKPKKEKKKRFCKKCGITEMVTQNQICDDCKHDVCKRCGKRFAKNASNQEFCSKECKMYTGKLLVCVECGNDFKEKRYRENQKYCSQMCSKKGSAKEHYDIAKFIFEQSKGTIVPLELINGSSKSIREIDVKCLKCGRVQSKQLRSLRNKVRCKYCTHAVSKGALELERHLIELGLCYEKEKTFADLSCVSNLRYDFFVEDKVLIEYDGRQHYEPVWGGDGGLKATKERDEIKNDYAKRKGISLIRISYDTKNMKDKLNSELKIAGVL